MATWEDGPEYAPVERPDEFSVPDTPPLSVAPPYVQPAAGAPAERPRFTDPQAPVRPLADLVPAPDEPRDPTTPYAVVSTTMTSNDSAWSAVHARTPTTPITTSASPWASSTGTAAVAGATPTGWPAAPANPSASPVPASTGFPAPGTPQWFSPPPYAPPAAPRPVTAKDVLTAVTPGLLIVLGLGGLIHPIAPITMLLAWALSSRVRVAMVEIRAAFALAVVILTVFGVVLGFLGIAFDFADWWDMVASVAMVLSWALIAAVIVLAHRALRGSAPPRPPGTTWG